MGIGNPEEVREAIETQNAMAMALVIGALAGSAVTLLIIWLAR